MPCVNRPPIEALSLTQGPMGESAREPPFARPFARALSSRNAQMPSLILSSFPLLQSIIERAPNLSAEGIGGA